MRGLLMFATMLVAIPAVAAAGELVTGGVGEIGAGYAFVSNNGTAEDAAEDTARIAASGRFNFGVTSNVSVQFDLRGEFVLGDADADSEGATRTYDGARQAAAHVSWRDPGRFLAGAFGSYGKARVTNDHDEAGFAFGPEAQHHFGDTTIYAQGGLFWSDEHDDETLTDAFFLRGVARHFLTPNSFVSVEGLYGSGESTEEDKADIDFARWGLRYTHGIGDSPVAVFAGYTGNHMSSDGGGKTSLTEHVLMVGITFAFGAESFQHMNTHGATLDVPLDMVRTAGYTVDVVD